MSEEATQAETPAEEPQSEPSFESSLTALEERVRRIDAGDLPLEDALRLFEEGVALARECHERLDSVEQRIIELTGNPETNDS